MRGLGDGWRATVWAEVPYRDSCACCSLALQDSHPPRSADLQAGDTCVPSWQSQPGVLRWLWNSFVLSHLTFSAFAGLATVWLSLTFKWGWASETLIWGYLQLHLDLKEGFLCFHKNGTTRQMLVTDHWGGADWRSATNLDLCLLET